MAMFLSIVKVVIVPIALGFVINKFFGKWTARAVKVLPLVSVIAIAMIVAAVVSHNAAKILSTGAIVFAVVILHNLLGYGCGFGLGKLLKFSTPKTKALSIEIGMQNSGLALRWRPSPAPSSPYGTTFRVRYSRTFIAERNKKISQRINAAPTLCHPGAA